MTITYNSPITDGTVVCPEQLFRNAPLPVDQGCIIGAASILTANAKGVCNLLTTDGGQSDNGFMTNHSDVIEALHAISGILEQLEAVLHHNSIADTSRGQS